MIVSPTVGTAVLSGPFFGTSGTTFPTEKGGNKKNPVFRISSKDGNKFTRGTTFVGAENLRPLKIPYNGGAVRFYFQKRFLPAARK